MTGSVEPGSALKGVEVGTHGGISSRRQALSTFREGIYRDPPGVGRQCVGKLLVSTSFSLHLWGHWLFCLVGACILTHLQQEAT